jgi:hypothetical protein
MYTTKLILLHKGEKYRSRLNNSTISPDSTQWEHLIAAINKRAGRHPFNGIETEKPEHRQLCLAICGLGKTNFEDVRGRGKI